MATSARSDAAGGPALGGPGGAGMSARGGGGGGGGGGQKPDVPRLALGTGGDLSVLSAEQLRTLSKQLFDAASKMEAAKVLQENAVHASRAAAGAGGEATGQATVRGGGDGGAGDDRASVAYTAATAGTFIHTELSMDVFSDFKFADPAMLPQLYRRACSHIAVKWPGLLQQQFTDMLLHRLFVLLAGSPDHPYDGKLRRLGLGVLERGVLDVCRLTEPLFTARNRSVVNETQFTDALRLKYSPDVLLVAALMMVFVYDASIADLAIDRKLFQQMSAEDLPFRNLYRALFYRLSNNSSVLHMQALRMETAWVVLSAYDKFAPQVPDSVTFVVDEWEAWMTAHVQENSVDAHKLLLSSLATLSEVTFDDIKAAKHRDCLSFDCTIS